MLQVDEILIFHGPTRHFQTQKKWTALSTDYTNQS